MGGSEKKTLSKKLLIGALALGTALWTTWGIKQSLESDQHKNELAPYTIVLSQESINNISHVKANEIDFTQPTILEAGEVIVSGITKQTPNGILRKVEKVFPGRTKVQTRNATLEEALTNADFTSEVSAPDGPYEATFAGGKTVRGQYKHGSTDIERFFSNVVVLDLDGNPATKYDQVTASGKFHIHSDFYLNLKLSKGHSPYISLRNKTTLETEVQLHFPASVKSIDREIDLAKYKLPPLMFFLPGTTFPMVITEHADVPLSVSGKVLQRDMSIVQNSNFNSEIYYKDGNWEKKSDNSTHFYAPNMNPLKDISFNASINPNLSFLIYGIAGPYAEVEGKAAYNSDEQQWNLDGSLSLKLGLHASAISSRIKDYEMNVFTISEKIAHGNFNSPTNLVKKQESTSASNQQSSSQFKSAPTQITQSPTIHSSLEDYFLRGKELEGIKAIPNFDPNNNNYSRSSFFFRPSQNNSDFIQFPINFPYLFSSRQLAILSDDHPSMKDVKQLGFSEYSLKGENLVWASQMVLRFNNPTDEEDFLSYEVPQEGTMIKKGDVASILQFYPQKNSYEDKVRLLNLVYNYHNRIGGGLYDAKNNRWVPVDIQALKNAYKQVNK